MKLGRNDLREEPDGQICLDLYFATRGPHILTLKVKICSFNRLQESLMQLRVLRGSKRLQRTGGDLWWPVLACVCRHLPTTGV